MTAMTSEAAFWAFFRFRILVPLFKKIQAAENEFLRLILNHFIFSIVSNSHECATAKRRTREKFVGSSASFFFAAR